MKHAFWYLLVALLAVVGARPTWEARRRDVSRRRSGFAGHDRDPIGRPDERGLRRLVHTDVERQPTGDGRIHWRGPSRSVTRATTTSRSAPSRSGRRAERRRCRAPTSGPIPDHTPLCDLRPSDKPLGSGTSCTSRRSSSRAVPRRPSTSRATIDAQRTTTFTYGEDIHVSYSVAGFAQVAGGCGDCIDPPPPLNGTMKVFYLVSGERVPPPVPVFLEDRPVAEGMGDCDVSGVPVGTSWRIVGEFVPDRRANGPPLRTAPPRSR